MENNPFLASYWNEENKILKKATEQRNFSIHDEQASNEMELCRKNLSSEEKNVLDIHSFQLFHIYFYLENHFLFSREIEGYYFEDCCGKSGWIYINDLPRWFDWSKSHVIKDEKYKAVRIEERLLKVMLCEKKTTALQAAKNSFKEERFNNFLKEFEKLFDVLPKKVVFSLSINELIFFIKNLYYICSFAKMQGALIKGNLMMHVNDAKKHIIAADDKIKDGYISNLFPKRLIDSSTSESLNLIHQWYKGLVLLSFFRGFYFKSFNIDNLKILSSSMLENIFEKVKKKILNEEYLFIQKWRNIEIDNELIETYGLNESYRNEYAQAIKYEEIKNYKKAAELYYTAGRIAVEEANTWKNIALDMEDDECRRTLMNLASVFYITANHIFTQSFILLCLYGESQGDVVSIGQLAKCYMEGSGSLHEDDAKAVKLFMKAAKQGDTFSIYELGKCYFEGIGVKKDVTKTFKWFEAISGKNKSYLFMSHAYCYEKVLGIPQNNTKLIDQYTDEKPETISQFAELYLKGSGVEKNKLQATYLYIKAAKKGYPYAMKALAKLYAEEENNIKHEIEQIFYFFQDKSNKGDSVDNYHLAFCFEYGIGTKKDISEAIILYWEAIQKGGYITPLAETRLEQLEQEIIKRETKEADRLYMIGCGYRDGIDFLEDHRIAAMHFLQAAEKGLAPAMYELAKLYEFGDGVVKNEELAKEWYQKAAKKKFPPAVKKLKDLDLLCNSVEENDKSNQENSLSDIPNVEKPNSTVVNCSDKLLIELEKNAKIAKTKVIALSLKMKRSRMIGNKVRRLKNKRFTNIQNRDSSRPSRS